ncbi:hypothetical protein [Micromonospora chersina]
MSEQTLPQRHPVQRDKQPHPADGSPRYSVKGKHGKVVYDLLGNHLAIIDTDGDYDSVMGATLARVREYAQLDDEAAVFAVLADLYRTELAGGAS